MRDGLGTHGAFGHRVIQRLSNIDAMTLAREADESLPDPAQHASGGLSRRCAIR